MRRLIHTFTKSEGIAVFAVLLALVVGLQALGGAYASGFGGDYDETSHLVTSLMARDFIAGRDFGHPWQFAQQYYYHYPHVMIGVWPPAFYGALGTWFLIVGASRVTAMIFIAIIAATTASVIYFIGKRLIGRWAGILASVLFVASPLVQESSAEVMHEHLVTLGMLVSALFFARFARTGRVSDGLGFGTAAAVAILTHGQAWVLGLVPGLSLALTNRWYLLRRVGLWLAAVPVLVTCVPWYVFTFSIFTGSFAGYYAPGAVIPNLAWCIYRGMGIPVLIFTFIGVWGTIIQVRPRAEVTPEWAALAGLAAAIFLLYCVFPVGAECRYMVLVIPSLVLFCAAGVNEVARRLTALLPIDAIQVGLVLTLLGIFWVDTFALPLQRTNGGYERLARDVMARVSNVPQVWLISSDPFGEGSLVAAVALQDLRRKSYVLRGKTILGGGDMYWRNMQDRFDTPEKLAAALAEFSVSIVVVDDEIRPDLHRPYQDRLRKLVADESDKWELIGVYSQIKDGVTFPNSLHVYGRRPVGSLTIAAPAIPLDRLKAMMVRPELR